MTKPALKTSGSFDRNLNSLLERTGYFRVEGAADREEIYRLRYDAYLQEGAIEPKKSELFDDHYDQDSNASIFAVTLDGRVAGTIRIHRIALDAPFGPALDTYPDILQPWLEVGESFVDPSRFVTDPSTRSDFRLFPFAVTRLACMAAERFCADWMLATVRVEHAAFYRRFCQLNPLSLPRQYPGLIKPLMLLGRRNVENRQSVFAKYPVFSSTPQEREALFGPAHADYSYGDVPARPVPAGLREAPKLVKG